MVISAVLYLRGKARLPNNGQCEISDRSTDCLTADPSDWLFVAFCFSYPTRMFRKKPGSLLGAEKSGQKVDRISYSRPYRVCKCCVTYRVQSTSTPFSHPVLSVVGPGLSILRSPGIRTSRIGVWSNRVSVMVCSMWFWITRHINSRKTRISNDTWRWEMTRKVSNNTIEQKSQ